LVTHRGLAIDRAAAPEPGKIAFVYRKKRPAPEVRGPETENRLQVTSDEQEKSGVRSPGSEVRSRKSSGLWLVDSGKRRAGYR